MEKTGFLEESPGVASSTRLIVSIIVGCGIGVVLSTLGVGLWAFIQDHGRDIKQLVSLAQAIGLEFTGTVIPAATMHIGGKLAEGKTAADG